MRELDDVAKARFNRFGDICHEMANVCGVDIGGVNVLDDGFEVVVLVPPGKGRIPIAEARFSIKDRVYEINPGKSLDDLVKVKFSAMVRGLWIHVCKKEHSYART